MRFTPTFLSVAGILMLASTACAADGALAPAPVMDRITTDGADSSILTTKPQAAQPAAAPGAALPWNPPATTQAAPFVATTPTPAMGAPAAAYQPKIPFGHADAPPPIIPEGPHATVSVPVVNVQSLEAPEASPQTPSDPAADPSKENPEEPTELTSPIFGDTDNANLPRKIILRLLNKVTATSTVLTLKPNETVKVGQLDITAITCQTSSPTSQTDYAGLVDIVERSQTNTSVKPLFRGWMYASSPSITALEHPVYDVTMVECQIQQPEKQEDKPAKKGKK